MKIKLLPKKIMIRIATLGFAFVMSIGASFALSGNYTINKLLPTAGTNFNSFNAFRAALAGGVTGPVTVDVVKGSGPYTEYVSFVQITGTSKTNTITINGNGERLTSTGSSSTYGYSTLEFEGIDWMTIDGLTIENTRSGSYYMKGIWIHNNSDNNTIKNCQIYMPNTASSYDESAYIGIMQSYSSRTSYGDPGENIVIDNNRMYSADRGGPYAGIIIVNESSGQTLHRVTITNNNIKNFYQSGVHGYYTSETVINGNEIHNTGSTQHLRGQTTMYGIYLYNYFKNVGQSETNDNNIHDLRNNTSTSVVYGTYLYDYYSYGTSHDVNNNEINLRGNGTVYGVYFWPYRSYLTGSVECTGNDITCFNPNTSTTSYYSMYGIYMYPYFSTSLKSIKINRNEVDLHNKSYAYGIYVYPYYCSGLQSPLEVKNNKVNCRSDYYQYGIYMSANYVNNGFDIMNNTVLMGKSDNGTHRYAYNGRSYALYMYYCNKAEVKNNMLVNYNRIDGYSYLYYTYQTNADYENNNLWIDGSVRGTKYYGYNGSNHTSFNAWVGAVQETNTLNENPAYTDPTESRPTTQNFALINAGMPLTEVTVDKDNNSRNVNTPDIGAIEFYFGLEPVSINLIGTAECAGYEETFTATLKNDNSFTIPFLLGQLKHNGVVVGEAQSTSGPVAPGGSADVEFTVAFFGAGTHTLELFGYRSDNTASVSKTIEIYSAPSGGSFTQNSGSNGMHLPGNFDVTIVPDGIAFDMKAPPAYTEAQYGAGSGSNGWLAKAVTTYADGTPVASADQAVWTAPSGSTPGYITLSGTTDDIIDSTINVCVNIWDETSNCDTTICRSVLIAPEGKPDFISPVVNCANDAVAFDNASTVSTGILTYEWDFGDGNTSVLTHPIHKYAAPGTYSVTLTTTTNPWEYKNSITKSVVITPVPTASFTRLNACEGSDIELTNTSTGATDYTWNFGDPAQADVYTKDATVQYTPGGYTVTLTAEANGCSDVVTKPVYQFAMPVAAFTNTSGSCNTDEFMFMNGSTISDGSVGYTWDFDDMPTLLSTAENPNIKFTMPGNHDVKLTAISEFGCENSTTQTISVKEGPAVSFTYDGGCSEEATAFTNGTTFPNVWNATHKWNFGDGSAISGDVNPTHNWNTTGDLDVTLTVDLDNGCSGMQTQTIKVAPQPKADFSVNDECVGSEVAFANNSTWEEGNIAFTWDFDGAITGGMNDIAPTGIAMTAGTYNVKLTAKVSEGCSNEVTKMLTISEAPVSCKIVATPDHQNGLNGYMFQSSTDGTTAGTEANVSYYWVVENHGTRTGSDINVNFQEEGDFTVSLTARNNTTGCECTESMNHNNVGIEDELSLENNFVVYPNPANSKLTVEIESTIAKGATIEMVNSLGATVMTIDSKDIVDDKVVIDVNDLASGLYLVRITSGQTISTKKVNIID